MYTLTPELLQQYATQDPALWALRDQRMRRHRELYELRKPPKSQLKPGQIVAVTNDAKAIVKKLASMIATHPPTIEVPSRTPDTRFAAERVETFLRWFREEEEHRYGMGPNGSRAFTEAEYLVRDGMLVDITVPDMDPEFPWYSSLPDPITIYPIYAGDRMERVTQVYVTTVGDLRGFLSRYGGAALAGLEEIKDRESKDPIRVSKVFCSKPGGGWEMGLLADGKVLYIAEIGFNPVTITYAGGRTYTLGESDGKASDGVFLAASGVGQEQYENVGVGIFDVLEEPLRNKNREYSMLLEMLAREANPPKLTFTDDEGKPDSIDLDPGAANHLWVTDKFQLLNVNPDFTKLQASLQISQQGIDRVVPGGLYGESQGSTGVQEYMLMGNARDMVFPYVRAHERFLRQKYRKVLELYRDFGTVPVQFTTRDPKTGISLWGEPFSEADIEQGPIQVIVRYSEITPQNEAARANMARGLVQEKILDLRTAREMLPAPYNESPERISQQVLEDMTLMHPSMTQVLALSSALLSPHPLVRAIAARLLPQAEGELQQGASQNAPGAPPNPGGQLPPDANPPELGNQAGLPNDQLAVPPQGSQPL